MTPAFLRRYFASLATTTGYRPYGTAYRPSQPSGPSSAPGSWTSSVQNPWRSRGAGRRLGGD